MANTENTENTALRMMAYGDMNSPVIDHPKPGNRMPTMARSADVGRRLIANGQECFDNSEVISPSLRPASR
jgi:hypothetical protein